MATYTTLTPWEVAKQAERCGRLNDFGGYRGWEAIATYLEDLSEETGEDIEIDIVAICCEYTHAGSVEEFMTEFSHDADSIIESALDATGESSWNDLSEREKLVAIETYLAENTGVVCVDSDCIIWQAF